MLGCSPTSSTSVTVSTRQRRASRSPARCSARPEPCANSNYDFSAGTCAKPAKASEPLVLLRRSIRNELRREKLPKCRILLAPAELRELDHHFSFFARLRGTGPLEPAARIAAVQDQMRHAFRMANRLGDRDRRALRDAEQRKAVAPACV